MYLPGFPSMGLSWHVSLGSPDSAPTVRKHISKCDLDSLCEYLQPQAHMYAYESSGCRHE